MVNWSGAWRCRLVCVAYRKIRMDLLFLVADLVMILLLTGIIKSPLTIV